MAGAVSVTVSLVSTGILMTIPAFTPFFSSGFRWSSSALDTLNFRQMRYIVSFLAIVYSISLVTVFISVVGSVSIGVAGIRIVLPMVKEETDNPGFAAIISGPGTLYRTDNEYNVSLGCIV